MIDLISDHRFVDDGCSLVITDMKEHCGEPLPIKGCAILLVESGVGVTKVNYQRFSMRKGYLGIFFYDDNVVIERVSKQFKCVALKLPYKIVEEPIYKVTTSGLWNFIYSNPLFALNPSQQYQIRGWWQQITWVMNHIADQRRREILKNSVHNLLLVIDSELHYSGYEMTEKEDNRARKIVTEFLELVAKHHPDHRDVKFYSDLLCIHTSYLYKLCFRVLSKTPKSIIDNQVLTAIKNLLMNTDLSVKNIATQLHFNDPSYMCRFFTRLEGTSPIDFRTNTTK